eukprot:GDKI01022979.1.p1 GENE.GDKI01022979.1~~GDKI01022979.1.p1  ORF type:complete len:248 (+),score=85.93 GDKI01022979.1:125-868(+)
MSNVRGLGDFRKDAGQPKDDKGTDSYAGGEKSGIAIQNPTDDLMQHRGTGPMPAGSKMVTLYRNGFTINDGPFRPSTDPENAKFIKEILAGYAPAELQEGAQGGSVHIAMNDKRQEDYKPPAAGSGGSGAVRAPPVNMFAGQGMSLGGSSSAAAAAQVNTNAGSVSVDESKPVTTLQIRFHNGQRKAERFNEDATVGHLRAYLQQCAPAPGGSFKILAGFPPKEVTASDSTTLKDAGLLREAVTQKI